MEHTVERRLYNDLSHSDHAAVIEVATAFLCE